MSDSLHHSRRLHRLVAGCGLVLSLAVSAALAVAQSPYPHLRMIVPSGPGGAWDTTARADSTILEAEGLHGRRRSRTSRELEG
jgi:tripartite-type tricarboxylate transporter receptor subunit TctC